MQILRLIDDTFSLTVLKNYTDRKSLFEVVETFCNKLKAITEDFFWQRYKSFELEFHVNFLKKNFS